MFQDLSFIALFQKGGVTVIVLLVFSLVSIAVMLERAFAFRGFKKALELSHKKMSLALGEGGPGSAASFARLSPGPLQNVFLAGLSRASAGRDAVLRAMELAGRVEVGRLERFLGVLGTIGSTAPFVGLFGTVIGIIRAFSDLAASQGVSPAAVADGIAEALVATAAGLIVAVPAVIAYNYFVRATTRLALLLEARSAEFTDALLPAPKDRGKDGMEP